MSHITPRHSTRGRPVQGNDGYGPLNFYFSVVPFPPDASSGIPVHWWRGSPSHLADTESGGMNELAAAAAVMAMSVDDDGIDDLGLEDAPGGAASDDVAMAALETTAEDKENSGVLPVEGEQRAANQKVDLRPRTQNFPLQRPPIVSCFHPAARRLP